MKFGKSMIWIAPLLVVLIGGTVVAVNNSHKNTTASGANSATGTQSATGTAKGSTTPSSTAPKPANAPSPEALVATNPDAKKVDLSTYNAKEKELTDEAEKIYNQISDSYSQLQKGTIKPADFKKKMAPLTQQMKNNFDEYQKFTQQNGVSEKDHDSATFKQGVVLASNIRLDEYTFLLYVTTYNLTKQQIADKYNATLSTFESRLSQYRTLTKNL